MSRPVAGSLLMRASLLAVMASISVVAVAQTDFDQIVFFGDSLSDPGNAFVLLGKVSVRPFEVIPDYPYARGGKHFSNGRTWAEQLAKGLQMNRSAKPAFRVPGVFTNYAVGSSRARFVGPPSFAGVNLTNQVALFAQDFPVAPSDALYSIVIGGNDVRDAIEALGDDPTGATSVQIIEDAIVTIAANMIRLMGMGANQFLVGNSPDLGLVPAVRASGPVAQFWATVFSVEFNKALDILLDSLEADPRVTITRLDVFKIVTDVVASPESFGLSEAEVPCLTFFVRAGAFCKQPDEYFFWDGIHPTRAGHRIVAVEAADVLNLN